jgi:hypothetical protein
MAEQMPADLQVRRLADLLEPFLHAVLAEIALASGVRVANRVDGKCLGNGDEGDGGGVPAG